MILESIKSEKRFTVERDVKPIIIPPLLFREFMSRFVLESERKVSFGDWSGKQAIFRLDKYRIPIDKGGEKAYSAHLLYREGGAFSLFVVSRMVPENEKEFFENAEIIVEVGEKASGEKDSRLGEKIFRTIFLKVNGVFDLRDEFTKSLMRVLGEVHFMTHNFDFGFYWTKLEEKRKNRT
jgi:hypothetical protein